jgi:multidrug efflux pump
MTLSVAIVISLIVSPKITPMMCAYLLTDWRGKGHGRRYSVGERVFEAVLILYGRSLRRTLQWPALVMFSLVTLLGFAIYLFVVIHKGFIPQQDNGLIMGGLLPTKVPPFS